MSASNRRQPTRSARISTTRPSNYYAQPTGWTKRIAQEEEQPTQAQHGFFPAITHFTDGVAALPREVMRQFTLLKETEGKAYPHEQAMTDIVNKINQLPPPPPSASRPQDQAYFGFSMTNSVNGSAPSSVIDGSAPTTQDVGSDTSEHTQSTDQQLMPRRTWFLQLNTVMKDMINAIDEKNIVLNSINETLGRHLSRLEDTLPYVHQEVSEEARLGSNTHWALPHMREQRRAGQAHEKVRRDMQATSNLAAAAAHVHENEIANARNEARREAIGQRRRYNVDSDFEQAPRKTQNPNKGKRPAPTNQVPEGKGAPKEQPPKKRKVDKGNNAGSGTAMSAALNGRLGDARGLTGFRDGQADARKKAKPGPATGAAKKKYKDPNLPFDVFTDSISRNNVNSPSLASSPTRGTFSTTQKRDFSPAAHQQRPTARARQNSTLSIHSNTRGYSPRPPGPTPLNKTNTNGPYIGATDLRGVANTTGKSIGEARSAVRGAYATVEGRPMVEQEGMHGALVVDGAGPDPSHSLKREETEPADDGMFPEPSRIHTVQTYGDKPNTPLASIETDPVAQSMARTRSNRGQHSNPTRQPKTSSPFTNSSAAFPRRAHDRRYNGRTHNGSPSPGHDENEGASDADVDARSDSADGPPSTAGSDEPRYCICNQPSYGSMVACDHDQCPREWFHLGCVGLTQEPPENTKWYCEECKSTLGLKRGRSGGRS